MGRFEVALVAEYLSTHRIGIETGTLYGAGAREMAKIFDSVYTVELNKCLHSRTQQDLAIYKNITCIHGDSKLVLKYLLPTLDQTQGLVCYLDAHWSGDHTVDWDKSEWQGRVETSYAGACPTSENQVPLLEELEALVSMYQGPLVIYIDDMDKFDERGHGTRDRKFVGEDWSHLSVDRLEAVIAPRVRHSFRPNDEQWIIVLDPVGLDAL
jgi:hypothetical protein